ncbi:MAG: glycosyltransferase family 4 protein [Acidobacteria bacterium]|nr:glycosyltransferase family 4 protein [Acidobacteriota bacterium]MBI3657596.1 glycosyltransferase family 4 protein [Acidobacteriota bacterium]
MKVLILLTDLFDAVGGIQTFNRALVKALSEIAEKKGGGVTVLVLNDGSGSELAGRYMTTPHSTFKGFHKNRFRFVLSAIRESRDADMVLFGHVHFSPLACAMNSVKKCLVVHGVDVWRRLVALQRLGVARMDHILSVSDYTRGQMAKYNGTALNRFFILPNTLEPFYGNGAVPPSRQWLGLPSGKMILSVSRLQASEYYKKLDSVIEAMPAVLQKVPDAFYVLVGDGNDRPRLEQMAKRLSVSNRVIFVGRVPDSLLPAYYQSSDIFVLPSLKEGFGIVFLEAMYYSKPCIGARAGGVPEVIVDGETGLLIDPGDAESLTDTMVRLLNHENLRVEMGRAGRERLEREFSFSKFQGRLQKALW